MAKPKSPRQKAIDKARKALKSLMKVTPADGLLEVAKTRTPNALRRRARKEQALRLLAMSREGDLRARKHRPNPNNDCIPGPDEEESTDGEDAGVGNGG